ncbi:hypothetical protein AMATHDRAFT_46456 [Amanita thiersii Skay4041]|uniref:F-box domain-containing protein n=1 Tax=Amanita thiersii Skay4041 TaxID=703135 RepID=A0A2A9NQG2_9AGAR|nr:hypothetical protein AMATHDRAFT_46456 [Amanita thiersii Skay4041]
MSTNTVLLHPRPYALVPGKLLLLPLLPLRKQVKPLPVEIWYHIFTFALHADEHAVLARSLLSVCKAFKDIALPLVYSNISIAAMETLERFYRILYDADQKWDSIRRIPYSSPGRWVHALNLSKLEPVGKTEALALDSLLTNLFPLVPFLTRLSINPSFILSRRALISLAEKDGIKHLCSLEGISYIPPQPSSVDSDPFMQLLKRCTNLEVLEVIGQALDLTDLESSFDELPMSLPESLAPLKLPKLHTLCVLSMHSSPLLLTLLNSPLPSLSKLTITPYHDIPYPASLTSNFIEIHGEGLRSLLFRTLKSWPTYLHPSPTLVLQTCPSLQHLSLENPLPSLTLVENHPLRILSIPRPNSEFWRVLEKLLPNLPALRVVRMRDVRWLKGGISVRAQETGTQGEMREWVRRLGRYGVHVLDADWKPYKS